MAHNFKANDGGTIDTGNPSTKVVDAVFEVGVGGKGWVCMHIEGTSGFPITISGGTFATGTDFYLASPIRNMTTGTNDDLLPVIIAFEPTTTGTKTDTFTITIEGTTYNVSIRGVAAANDVAIRVIGGLTPGYGAGTNREAPCVICATFDPENTHLPAKFPECYFKWVVTPPGGQTLNATDQRAFGGSEVRNLFNHFPGCSIAVPVLEGQHGVWKLDLSVHVPGDDGDSPSLTATQVSVTVDQLGTNRTTYHASATGAGTADGSTEANRGSYSSLRTALANDMHIVLYDTEGNFDHTASWDWGSVQNVSMVAASGDTPNFRLTGGSTDQTININDSEGAWVQGIDITPTITTGTRAIGLSIDKAEGVGLYEVSTKGDGFLTAGTLDGRAAFGSAIVVGSGILTADWPQGVGLFFVDHQPSTRYAVSGQNECCVLVGTRLRGATTESTLRWFGSGGYPVGTLTNPFEDRGGWFSNSVDCYFDRINSKAPPNITKDCFRYTHGMFLTLHRCRIDGQLSQGMGGIPPRICHDSAAWHCNVNSLDISARLIYSVGPGYTNSQIGCYLRRNTTMPGGASNGLRYETIMVACTLDVTADTSTFIEQIDQDGADPESFWGAPNDNEDRVSAEFDRNIVIKTINLGAEWFKTGNLFGTGYPFRKDDSIVNNVFPLTSDENFEAEATTVGTVALFNAENVASGNIEQDITLDANGRPNEDVSSLGRDNRLYYDYFMKACTSSDTWAGMAQSAAAGTTENYYEIRAGGNQYILQTTT